MEPRATGFLIPVVDDPEGNMIELFPNIDHMPLPDKALCPPEHIDAALAQVRAGFAELTKNLEPGGWCPAVVVRNADAAATTAAIEMPTILDKIVATKRVEIERAKAAVPESELRARLADAPPVRNFFTPLAASGPIKLIAEVKKASPSAGVIRADFDPVAIAKTYEAHGATLHQRANR